MDRHRNEPGSEFPFSLLSGFSRTGSSPGKVAARTRDDEERAQDLVYDAMEAETAAEQLRLARLALKLDGENVDALLMVAEGVEMESAERIAALRGIVAVGARRLGQRAFKELAPHFWGVLETRPYMRARAQLAWRLVEAGRLEEAVAEYAAMLELNENDNQGVRYELLPLLLALGRLDEARALLERCKDEVEWSVVVAWGRVLARWLSGDKASATRALTAARKQNPHMEAYLTGARKPAKDEPDYYSPGSREEAQSFAKLLLRAWQVYPEAQAWLVGKVVRSADEPVKRKGPSRAGRGGPS